MWNKPWWKVHVFNAVMAPTMVALMVWLDVLPLIIVSSVVCGGAWTTGGLAWVIRREGERLGIDWDDVAANP
jgi:hypothetical protein